MIFTYYLFIILVEYPNGFFVLVIYLQQNMKNAISLHQKQSDLHRVMPGEMCWSRVEIGA